MAFDITDELFAINIARDGYLNPLYTYGAMICAMPMWASGTALGAIAGNIMPARLVSALSVALYGMFLAVIIPPSRNDKILRNLILCCFALSFAFYYLPFLSSLSEGTRTIVLTIIISSAMAILFPKTHSEEEA